MRIRQLTLSTRPTVSLLAVLIALVPVTGLTMPNGKPHPLQPPHAGSRHVQIQPKRSHGNLALSHQGGHYSTPRSGDQHGRKKPK